MYIPPGFSAVTPYFLVQDAPAFLAFLQGAFGAELGHQSLRADGSVANALVSLSGSSFMVAESGEAFPAMPASYYLYVADAVAVTARAVEHGAELIMPVGDKPYGDRQGGVRDPHGNLWWISQRMVHAPYAG